jgi:hypothetical protein
MTSQAHATPMALAFINAAVPVLRKGARPSETWVARRVAINCDRDIGMVRDPIKRRPASLPGHPKPAQVL